MNLLNHSGYSRPPSWRNPPHRNRANTNAIPLLIAPPKDRGSSGGCMPASMPREPNSGSDLVKRILFVLACSALGLLAKVPPMSGRVTTSVYCRQIREPTIPVISEVPKSVTNKPNTILPVTTSSKINQPQKIPKKGIRNVTEVATVAPDR